MSIVRIQNVSIELGGHPVVREAGFEIQAGEMVGLIGPNGAGKSTLMKALAGLLPYQQGTIEILGASRSAPGHEQLARRVAYLPQTREVHWPLSVRRIVALGRLPHLQPWQGLSGEDESIIETAMREADIADLGERSVHELAGGELALVLLARVLANQPALILADEPVAGLDPNHQIQVMQLLKERAGRGNGVLAVLHDLSLAARFCDKLVLIHEGRILAAGEPREVLSAANLKAGYKIEAKFGCEPDGFYVIPWRRL